MKEEWEEKQRRKKEKEKEAAKAENEKKDEEKKDGNKENKDKGDEAKEKKKEGPSSPVKAPSAPATPAPTHERYILHRDFFASGLKVFPPSAVRLINYAVRQAEHRRRRQAAQAKELAPRLPGAPSGSVG